MFIMIFTRVTFFLSINQLFILYLSRTIRDSIPFESHNSHPEVAKIAFAGLREPWTFQFVGRFSLAPTSDIGSSGGGDTADRGFGNWRRGGYRCYFRYLCERRYSHSLPVAFTRPKAPRRSLRPHFRVRGQTSVSRAGVNISRKMRSCWCYTIIARPATTASLKWNETSRSFEYKPELSNAFVTLNWYA